jgi:general secretion pathway protein G
MKKLNLLAIFLLLQSTLLFSQTPWFMYIKEIKSKAENGDPDPQGILSFYIQNVEGSGSNEEAYMLSEKSANSSSCYGYYSLGKCHEKGVGVSIDETKAQQLYSKAILPIKELALSGNTVAQSFLGICYNHGRGVAKDENEALKWYRKAAEQGDAVAQYNLGVCYANGSGVAKDESEAERWVRKSLVGISDFDKEQRVNSDIEAISMQLRTYEMLNYRMPTTEQGLKALVSQPSTEPRPRRWKQLMKSAPIDPWGAEYIYHNPGKKNASGFDVYSLGPDGKESEDDIGK